MRNSEEKLVGFKSYLAWPREKNYKPQVWYQVATEIANQDAKDLGKDPREIWRDLQFQQIYNIGQKMAQEFKKDYVICPGRFKI